MCNYNSCRSNLRAILSLCGIITVRSCKMTTPAAAGKYSSVADIDMLKNNEGTAKCGPLVSARCWADRPD
jgi:hypothetical protein